MNSSNNIASPASIPSAVVNVPVQPTPPSGVHPAAELFPLMKGTEFGVLVEDIDAHGLREPILVYQGLVLDGRNRLRACEVAGVEPRFVEWDGVGSPLALVLSRNLHRRHLNESQRAVIAARAKSIFEDEAAERERAHQFGQERQAKVDTGGENQQCSREITAGANLHQPGRSNAKAAELLNVSQRSVAAASRVLASGDEQVIAAVESGDVAVSDARSIADRPKPEQRQALEAVRQGQARTLRQAAEIESGHPTTSRHDDEAPAFSAQRLRAEGKRFSRELDKLLRRLEAFTACCGGPNDHTRRMRDMLAALLRTLHDCIQHLKHAK